MAEEFLSARNRMPARFRAIVSAVSGKHVASVAQVRARRSSPLDAGSESSATTISFGAPFGSTSVSSSPSKSCRSTIEVDAPFGSFAGGEDLELSFLALPSPDLNFELAFVHS